MSKIHRWQPTGKTPCGRRIQDVAVNIGRYLSEGVTCERCHKAVSLSSVMGDDWNGQSDGMPRAVATEYEVVGSLYGYPVTTDPAMPKYEAHFDHDRLRIQAPE